MPRRLPLHSFAVRWLKLIEVALDPYRPELYYMRGPGPRWHAKHDHDNEGVR